MFEEVLRAYKTAKTCMHRMDKNGQNYGWILYAEYKQLTPVEYILKSILHLCISHLWNPSWLINREVAQELHVQGR